MEIERYHCQCHRREKDADSRYLKRSRESKRKNRNNIFTNNGNITVSGVRPVETRIKVETRERKRIARRSPSFLEAYCIRNMGGNCRLDMMNGLLCRKIRMFYCNTQKVIANMRGRIG